MLFLIFALVYLEEAYISERQSLGEYIYELWYSQRDPVLPSLLGKNPTAESVKTTK